MIAAADRHQSDENRPAHDTFAPVKIIRDRQPNTLAVSVDTAPAPLGRSPTIGVVFDDGGSVNTSLAVIASASVLQQHYGAQSKERVVSTKAFDVAIIGSGVAGGVVAERLSRRGRSCVMLEAGRRYSPEDFPLSELTQGTLFWKQGMEFTTDGRMMVLSGKCVGGSSIVNQALLDRPNEDVLERWADSTGISELRPDQLGRIYDRLLRSGRFEHRIIPPSANNGNADVFVRGMGALGFGTRQLRRAQSDCGWDQGNNCIDCLGGCRHRSKQSTLWTSLARAEEAGLEIVGETHVAGIDEHAEGVVIHAVTGRRRSTYRARTVVLAAGSLGTTEILLRSGYKKKLPAVGERFHLHPQYNSFARFDRPVNGHVGAFQSVASDEPRFTRLGFKIEAIGLPRSVMAATLPWAGGDRSELADYAHWACAEVSIRDEEPGRIAMGAFGSGRTLHKPMSPSDHRKLREGRAVLTDVFRSAGATEVVHGWISMSVHPMGGCAIGTDPHQSVVGPDFRVHGSKAVYVVDSSLFPEAIGCNPSLTVMALADLAADAIDSRGAIARG